MIMGFFSSSAPKKRESCNSDLTILDPPDLSSLVNIPSTSQKDFKRTTEQNGQTFISTASQVTNPSPTDSEFSIKSNSSFQNITSSGLKGEQERNLVLEQQVKILSHQAALALDQLNDMTKENEYLRKQNNELHNNNKRHTNKISISSSTSSQLSSIFSSGKESMMSKGSSMNSLSSYTDSSVTELKQTYEAEIKTLQSEIKSLRKQLHSNDSLIDEYKQQHSKLTHELNVLNSKNSNIFQKLMNSNKKQKLQIDYYQSELKDVLKQMEETRKRDHELRKRLMEYDSVSTHMNSRLLC